MHQQFLWYFIYFIFIDGPDCYCSSKKSLKDSSSLYIDRKVDTGGGPLHRYFFLEFSIASVKTENWFPYKLGYYSGSCIMYSYIYYFTCTKNKR